jgi:lycopene cyclase domain-containing protein
MGNPVYLLILSGLFLISFYFHKKFRLSLFKTYKHALVYFLIIFLSGLSWDYFSVSQEIWSFPIGGTIGLNIGILPIEEYLFFLVAPYLGLTIYKFLELKMK